MSNKQYSVEMNNFCSDIWNDHARLFSDFTIYQSLEYQDARTVKKQFELSSFILRDKSENVVLMCLVRIIKVWPLGLRIGYVQWGPLINRRGIDTICNTNGWALLRDSYIPKIVDVLRIVPNIIADKNWKKIDRLLGDSKFYRVPYLEPYHSIYVPVSNGENAIRSAFHRSWRRSLKKAENNKIEIRHGSDIKLFHTLSEIYENTKERKGFKGIDTDIFYRIQCRLREIDKMHLIVAYWRDEPIAGHASSFLGDIGEGIIAGNTLQGREMFASYLVWFHTLVTAHQKGAKMYNLGGIDPKGNRTVYQFKMRMGGKETFHIGTYDAYRNNQVRILWKIIETLYRLKRK